MPSVLVTGSSRGLGFEFVKQYAADGWHVIATCRNPEKADTLKALAGGSDGRVTLHPLDVADIHQIDSLAASLEGHAVDVLINNAGVSGGSFGGGLGDIDYDMWEQVFRVNTMAIARMTHAFLPHLERGDQKKLITISSGLGSIGGNDWGGLYVYRSSKAAANAVTRSLALDLKDKHIIAAALIPGWVMTDMGGPGADITPDVSIAGMRKVIAGLTLDKSGTFISYEGKTVEW